MVAYPSIYILISSLFCLSLLEIYFPNSKKIPYYFIVSSFIGTIGINILSINDVDWTIFFSSANSYRITLYLFVSFFFLGSSFFAERNNKLSYYYCHNIIWMCLLSILFLSSNNLLLSMLAILSYLFLFTLYNSNFYQKNYLGFKLRSIFSFFIYLLVGSYTVNIGVDEAKINLIDEYFMIWSFLAILIVYLLLSGLIASLIDSRKNSSWTDELLSSVYPSILALLIFLKHFNLESFQGTTSLSIIKSILGASLILSLYLSIYLRRIDHWIHYMASFFTCITLNALLYDLNTNINYIILVYSQIILIIFYFLFQFIDLGILSNLSLEQVREKIFRIPVFDWFLLLFTLLMLTPILNNGLKNLIFNKAQISLYLNFPYQLSISLLSCFSALILLRLLLARGNHAISSSASKIQFSASRSILILGILILNILVYKFQFGIK